MSRLRATGDSILAAAACCLYLNRMQLDEKGARLLLLAAQGIIARPKRKATKRDVLTMIRRMGALQIDTIHVVARSPYFVLWSRLGEYEPVWLEELLEEGAIFEYWSHEACFLPVEDYPLYRRRMLEAESMGWKYSAAWVKAHRKEIDGLKRFIREHGAVRAADFERTDGKAGGWWEWKTEKRALEMLFTAGELMIARRRNFQRVYDLRERVLPGWDDAQLPSREEVRRELALKAVRALGIAKPRWVADYFRTNMKETLEAVRALAEEGELLSVEVEGWDEPGLIHPDNIRLAKSALEGSLEMERTTLLSPFDPVVWDRARARFMFDFDYRLECYTPEAKRRYGYFTLPILRRGSLVGRLDAKAHRKDGVFEIRSLYMEPGVKVKAELIEDIAAALTECARWHKTPEIIVRQSDPPALASRLQRAVS
ncbi:MAG TPA: crosslink repair DNA glycosylase YcaQ family protein [Pyrinomonadaceae bacterium]